MGTRQNVSPEYFDWVRAWATTAQDALVRAAEVLRVVLESEELSEDPTAMFLGQSNVQATLTSDSVFLLLVNGRIWDAEPLIRAVSEVSVRIAYICSYPDPERAAKANEFVDILPDIASLERHERAQRFLSSIPNPEADEWQAIRDVVLPSEEARRLAETYPKKARREMTSGWTFGSMARRLTSSAAGESNGLGGLAYGYGVSSHLTHLDANALLMIAERRTRSPERIAAIELAHAGRLISDILSYAALRVDSILRTYRAPRAAFREWLTSANPILESIHKAHERWHQVEYGNPSSDSPDPTTVPT